MTAWDGRPANPERVWIGQDWDGKTGVEYVRADMIASQVAAAVMAERARCADAAHNAIHDAVYEITECERVKSAVLDALAALPTPTGADTLAAMLTAARREGIEAAAELIEQHAQVCKPETVEERMVQLFRNLTSGKQAAAAIRALLPEGGKGDAR